MGAVPSHPFFLEAIKSLQGYNHNWQFPYITIMSSTGPLYLSLIWRHYNTLQHTAAERVRLLLAAENKEHSWSFFYHYMGSSWHMWDAHLIFWVWLTLVILLTEHY